MPHALIYEVGALTIPDLSSLGVGAAGRTLQLKSNCDGRSFFSAPFILDPDESGSGAKSTTWDSPQKTVWPIDSASILSISLLDKDNGKTLARADVTLGRLPEATETKMQVCLRPYDEGSVKATAAALTGGPPVPTPTAPIAPLVYAVIAVTLHVVSVPQFQPRPIPAAGTVVVEALRATAIPQHSMPPPQVIYTTEAPPRVVYVQAPPPPPYYNGGYYGGSGVGLGLGLGAGAMMMAAGPWGWGGRGPFHHHCHW